jgi:hypothetical protein
MFGGSSPQMNDARKLVMDFVEYTTKVLNEDMKGFFESNMDLFDQDDADLTDGTGHSLEQYEVFQKYERILEGRIDDFATEKGYASAVACFEAIQEALVSEKKSHKNLMSDLQKQFASMRKMLLKSVEKNDEEGSDADSKHAGSSSSGGSKGDGGGEEGDSKMAAKGGAKEGGAEGKGSYDEDGGDGDGAKAAAKGGDDDGADAKGGKAAQEEEDDEEPPSLETVPMFFAPLPLERMLDSILKLSEYDTFSQIMRTKVKQAKFARALDARIKRQPEDIEERDSQLRRGGRYLESGELFAWLQKRMAEMLPEGLGGDSRDSIYKFLDKESWDKVIVCDILETNEEKLELKRLISFTFGHLQRLGLIEDFMLLRRIAVELMADIDQGEMRVSELATKFLRQAHETIDTAEQNLFKAFQEHKLL